MQPNFKDLAAQARPVNDDDWGSGRQIDAQNLFFQEVEKVLPADKFADLDNYCLKATTDEMIDKAIEMLSEHHLLTK
jgi:hypothetical protein